MSEQNENAIVLGRMNERGLVLSTFDDLKSMALLIAKAGVVQDCYKNRDGTVNVPALAICIQAGLEVGFSPIQSIKDIYVINGRPCLHSDGPLALVQASGHFNGIKEWIEGEPGTDGWTAYCTIWRKGVEHPVTESFSWAEAKQAGLTGKQNWKNYPKRMLRNRARTFAIRTLFADVMKGLGDREEAQDFEVFDPSQMAVVQEHRSRNDELDARLGVAGRTQGPQEPQDDPEPADELEPDTDDDRLFVSEIAEMMDSEPSR